MIYNWPDREDKEVLEFPYVDLVSAPMGRLFAVEEQRSAPIPVNTETKVDSR